MTNPDPAGDRPVPDRPAPDRPAPDRRGRGPARPGAVSVAGRGTAWIRPPADPGTGGWVDLGWIDADGLVAEFTDDPVSDARRALLEEVGQQAHRAAASTRALAGAVTGAAFTLTGSMDRRTRQAVDRARQAATTATAAAAAAADRIDDATENRCACGCGTPITDDSPSAYYASPECQELWMSRHVDDPDDVYDRRDAADYPISDSMPQGLNDRPHRRGQLPPRPPGRVRDLIHGPGRLPHELAYCRTCPACDAFMEPNVYAGSDTDVIHTFGDDTRRVYLHAPTWEQECSSCGAALLGTAHLPRVNPTSDPPGWILELYTDFGRVRTTVTEMALRRHPHPAEYIATTWVSMERDLARFERQWALRSS